MKDAAISSTTGAARSRLGPWQDLAYQARITAGALVAEPLYEEVSSDAAGYVEATAEALGAPVAITSWGPRAGDKRGQ